MPSPCPTAQASMPWCIHTACHGDHQLLGPLLPHAAAPCGAEKNLAVLKDWLLQLPRETHLCFVGDGPALADLQQHFDGLPVTFTVSHCPQAASASSLCKLQAPGKVPHRGAWRPRSSRHVDGNAPLTHTGGPFVATPQQPHQHGDSMRRRCLKHCSQQQQHQLHLHPAACTHCCCNLQLKQSAAGGCQAAGTRLLLLLPGSQAVPFAFAGV